MTEIVVVSPYVETPVVVSPDTSTVVTTPVVVSGTTVGPQGPKGDKGDKGDTGLPGGSYTHNQNTPSTTWTITHNLGYRPSVAVVDSGGTQVEGSVTWIDGDSLTVTFTYAFSGVAYLS